MAFCTHFEVEKFRAGAHRGGGENDDVQKRVTKCFHHNFCFDICSPQTNLADLSAAFKNKLSQNFPHQNVYEVISGGCKVSPRRAVSTEGKVRCCTASNIKFMKSEFH